MESLDPPRARWLAHLERVLAVSEARKGRLDPGELAAIARELGISDDDLAAAHKEAEDHFARGQGFAARELWHDAITELTEAHTLAPERLDISLALARAHQRRGDSADLGPADRLARMALEWEPGNQIAFSILADLDAHRRAGANKLRRLGIGAAVAIATVIAAGALFATPSSQPVTASPEVAAAPAQAAPAPPAPAAPAAPAPSAHAAGSDAGCPPGTAFSPDQGCVAKSFVITPGIGFAEVRLGKATPADVMATFGEDAKVNRYSSGEIFSISYDYDETGKYDASRRRNWTRPHDFAFKDEILREISVGVYNRQLRTPGGLNAQTSSLDDALREFGDHYELRRSDPLDTYRWAGRGIEVWINRESKKVNSFKIVAAETL